MRRNKFLVVVLCIIIILSVACVKPGKKPPVKETKPIKKEPNISLYVVETGEIKKFALEEYLKGVVAAEMETDWPLEALAAQAILARTFTLEKIEEGGVKARGTDASTDIKEFQAYNAARITDRVAKAVKMTRGKVIKYKGELIKAWFFADGGGKTASSAKEGLGFTNEPTPYIKSVKDPGINITTDENKSWTTTFSLDEINAAVRNVSGKNPGNINQVKVVEKGPSGRAMKIKFGEAIVSGPAIRLALGNDRMRSTLLTHIGINKGQVVMQGKGYGHGVGMSQWGARALAEQGKKPEEIIKYFFRDIEIIKEYN